MRRLASTRPALLLGPLLLICSAAAPEARAGVEVFRDRAAFAAAAQNLNTVDFESSVPRHINFPGFELDGLAFSNSFGPVSVEPVSPGDHRLRAGGVGELTQLIVALPPGTTAVGCDLFSRSVSVSASPQGGVFVGPSDGSDFVGFTSDGPIRELVFAIDAPEPTDDVTIDNLSFGQRRSGDEPPAPLLFVLHGTGGAAALNAATQTPEPFRVETAHNLSDDRRTRLSLFLAGVGLEGPADLPHVTARAVDSHHRVYDLPVEAVGRVKKLSWMTQVNVLLPPTVRAAGELHVTVTVRNATSNPALVRVD